MSGDKFKDIFEKAKGDYRDALPELKKEIKSKYLSEKEAIDLEFKEGIEKVRTVYNDRKNELERKRKKEYKSKKDGLQDEIVRNYWDSIVAESGLDPDFLNRDAIIAAMFGKAPEIEEKEEEITEAKEEKKKFARSRYAHIPEIITELGNDATSANITRKLIDSNVDTDAKKVSVTLASFKKEGIIDSKRVEGKRYSIYYVV